MKKIIKILQSNVEPLLIEDENDESLTEYSLKISNILSSKNIVILETTSSNIILKPSNIISMIIVEEGKSKKVSIKKKDPQSENKIKEDIITDVE